MQAKTEYIYLRIARKGLRPYFTVIVSNCKTSKPKSISIETANKLHEQGLLYNKKLGNDFAVDIGNLKEAQTLVDCYTNGWKVKYDGGFFYVISKGRKQHIINLGSLRQFYPEYI